MQYRPFHFLGDSQRERLRHHLATALETWCRQWLPAATTHALLLDGEIAAADQWSHRAGQDWFAVDGGDGTLAWTRLEGGAMAALLVAAAGGVVESVVETPFARQLGQKLYASLLEQFFGIAPNSIVLGTEYTTPAAECFDVGNGAVGIALRLGGAQIPIIIRRPALERIAPSQSPSSGPRLPLARMESAIAGQTLQVRVHLEAPGPVILDDLRDLAVGHTVVLDRLPSAVWQVAAPDGAALGRCRPGKVGNRVVVKLLAIERNS